jgi:Acyl-coenzyme A:6-aminopenicillanic acid acyl-transferase/Leucine Rich repeat
MRSRKRVAAAGAGLVLLVGAVYLAAGAKERTSSSGFIQKETVIAGSPRDSIEVRHVILSGSNEEIGRALADLAKERYRVKALPSQDLTRTRAQRRYIEKNFPILHERMRGVAASFGHRLDDDSWNLASLDFTELRAGCSIIHVPPGVASTGQSVVSRDYDYSTGAITFGFLPPGMLHPTARPYLVELHPDRGYASLAMVSYDLLSGVLDGMNSEGLTVALAMDDELFSKHSIEPTVGPSAGLGVLQTLRMLLDTCATVDEAKEALLETKQYYEYVPVHYLIADRFGRSFVWEYSHAHNKEYIIENPDHPLILTNFSLNRRLNNGGPPSVDQAKDVCNRYCLLSEQLAGAPGKISVDFIKQTHKKVDAELPAALDRSRPPVRTFWHALYYPEERRMQVSFYLHDQATPGEPNKPGVVRSDYWEFRLTPTNLGKPPGEPSAVAEPRKGLAAGTMDAKQRAAVVELEDGGAKVKIVGERATTVDLSKAKDLGRLLPTLHKLPNLEELRIQNPGMDDAGIATLEGLPKLARLGLYGTGVGDEGLKVLKSLPNLRVLRIDESKVTDAGLVHLKDLTQLEQLGLRGNLVADAGLVHLKRLAKVTALDLGGTKLTDSGLRHLKGLTQLEILILTGDNITDAGLAQLEALTSVTGLFLGSTKISDAGFVHLKPMGRLTKLNVSKTAVTAEGIAKARKFLPSWITIQQ